MSHSFGYGLMDATGMVKLAKKWKKVGPQRVYETNEPIENTYVYTYSLSFIMSYCAFTVLMSRLRENNVNRLMLK